MSTETPTRSSANIISRLFMALVVVVIAVYGYNESQNFEGIGATLLTILSAVACFVGLVAFYRAAMEFINRRKAGR